MFSLVIYLICVLSSLRYALVIFASMDTTTITVHDCHSCYSGCRNVSSDDCDCGGSSSPNAGKCRGEYCYVRLDRLSSDDDDGTGIIRKGCANTAPAEYMDTCQYVSDNTTVECYCRGDLCNDRSNTKLHDYKIDPLPLISCCECDGFDWENGTTDCLGESCLRNCTGNYCYNNIVSQSQGCGWGYSVSRQFLRKTSTRSSDNDSSSLSVVFGNFTNHGGFSCTEAYSDSDTLVRECTCAHEDYCNLIVPANEYVQNVTESRDLDGQELCYAVHNVSSIGAKPIDLMDAFRQSTTCPGHYCFITLTTTTLFQERHNITNSTDFWDESLSRNLNSTHDEVHPIIPTLATRYELTAGCILVGDPTGVQNGCTDQWSESAESESKQLIKRHCICQGHLCNLFTSLNGENPRKYIAFDWKISSDYQTIISAKSSSASAVELILFKNHYYCLLLFSVTILYMHV